MPSFDYSSTVATGQLSDADHIQRGGSRRNGPWITHGLLWSVWCDDTNIKYSTKQILDGGSWSTPTNIVACDSGEGYDLGYRHGRFHITYKKTAADGVLYYRRMTPASTGVLTLGAEKTAYSDGTWSVEPDNHRMLVDEDDSVFAIVYVHDGSTGYKPVVISNVSQDDNWTSRTGFPKDLAASDAQFHGIAGIPVEMGSGQIGMAYASLILDPAEIAFRKWTPGVTWDAEGTLGSEEQTTLTGTPSQRVGSVFHADTGLLWVVRETTVAERATNGTWGAPGAQPTSLITSNRNTMSRVGTSIRCWDRSTTTSRYQESTDEADTWGAIQTAWTITDLQAMAVVEPVDAWGDYHAGAGAAGSGTPWDLVIGIEGSIPDGTLKPLHNIGDQFAAAASASLGGVLQ